MLRFSLEDGGYDDDDVGYDDDDGNDADAAGGDDDDDADDAACSDDDHDAGCDDDADDAAGDDDDADDAADSGNAGDVGEDDENDIGSDDPKASGKMLKTTKERRAVFFFPIALIALPVTTTTTTTLLLFFWDLQVMFYYYRGPVSWSWHYRFFYPPFVRDVMEYLREQGEKWSVKFDLGRPFLPFQQLMGVLPGRSAQFLPEVYRQLMFSPSSPIIDYYPTTFEVDMDGCTVSFCLLLCLRFFVEMPIPKEVPI